MQTDELKIPEGLFAVQRSHTRGLKTSLPRKDLVIFIGLMYDSFNWHVKLESVNLSNRKTISLGEVKKQN